ncbi:MAG: LacI family DNA-binding transcriptional regulator [Actinomycetota bacterium]
MADVAKRAGVSLSTVSYALSGERPISAATRERVRRAMEELDYAPNALARGLASRRSSIIALLLPTSETDTDPFMAEIIFGATEQAQRSDHHLLLWTDPSVESRRLVELTRQGLIDGALVTAVRLDDPRVSVLSEAGLPFTLIGRNATCELVDHVDADDEQAVELTIGHLAELGHRRVAFIGADLDEAVSGGFGIMVRLVEQLRRAADAAGMELTFHGAERSSAGGRSLIRHVVGAAPEVTAAIVMNDLAVGGVLAGLEGAGLSVPEDFSVIGLLATSLVAELTNPRLTTVSPSPARIGQLAAETLIGGLGRPERPPSGELVGAALTIRESTARRSPTAP